MSRRIDIELTSALPDDQWTWRAAGAKLPKGTLDGSILGDGAKVGDVIKVEVEQEMDGITILSVVGGRQRSENAERLELLPSEREFKPVIETRAKRERGERRDGGRRRDRDGRGDRGRGRGDRGRDDRNRGDRDRDDRDQGGRGRGGRDGRRDGGDRDDRRGRRDGRGRRGPSFTPPPEVPQRPKPKRLKPGKANRNAVLAELPEEQRSIAELALQGMPAVRQRLREENAKAKSEGRSPMPEATVLKLAEDLLPTLRVAEWRDRAEAAQRQMEHLDLRDLRSVVAAAGDPAVARDETTSALANELSEALATKQEQELLLWFGDVDAALAVGRVIRALRLSSQPPKAGVPFPSDIAQRLVDSTNASLSPVDSAERWIAMLEAAAFSPVRTAVAPTAKPDQVTDELLATVKRLAPALPKVAALFEIEVADDAPMPKPLRQNPRNRKGKPADGGQRRKPARSSGSASANPNASAPEATPADTSETGPEARGAAAPEPEEKPAATDDAATSEDAAAEPEPEERPAATDEATASEDAAEAPTPPEGGSEAAPDGDDPTAPAGDAPSGSGEAPEVTPASTTVDVDETADGAATDDDRAD